MTMEQKILDSLRKRSQGLYRDVLNIADNLDYLLGRNKDLCNDNRDLRKLVVDLRSEKNKLQQQVNRNAVRETTEGRGDVVATFNAYKDYSQVKVQGTFGGLFIICQDYVRKIENMDPYMGSHVTFELQLVSYGCNVDTFSWDGRDLRDSNGHLIPTNPCQRNWLIRNIQGSVTFTLRRA